MSNSYDHDVGQISVEDTEFPNGLRVLAVDDNEVCLKLLVRLLQQCRYKVTSTKHPMEALQKLRENKDNFDIVITDVKNLDMDGFSLLDTVVLETDVPVIMTSADESKSTVMKGIRHGAQDYLLKPVRIEEIRNIWQHVVRKSLIQPNNKCCIMKEEIDQSREFSRCIKEESADETNANSCPKKRQKRLKWTAPLHNKFVDAIEQLGNNAVPKQILKVMNEPGLRRANVSSHLQKFRRILNPTTNQEGNSRAGSYKRGSISKFNANQNGNAVTQSGMHCADMSRNHYDHIHKLNLKAPQFQFLNQKFTPQLVDQMMQQNVQFTPQLMQPPQLMQENGYPSPLWIENNLPVQQLNGLKYPYCNSVGSEAGRSSNMCISSYPLDSSRMLGGGDSTEMIQLNSVYQNFIKDSGQQMNGPLQRYPSIQNLSETEGGFHRSSSEDDLATIINQFGNYEDRT